MSTFGGLNTAYTGLIAARKGLEVVGQNIANANTQGYTRQRITTSSVDAISRVGLMSAGVQAGQGVNVDGVARLGSAQLDAQVRSSAAVAGYSAVRSNALTAVEASMNEPGKNGLSAQLDEFWAGWHDVSNSAGDAAPAGVLLGQAAVVTTQIAQGYQAVANQWSTTRTSVDGMVSEINSTATQVAALNVQIRNAQTAGGGANELLDKRNTLTTTLAALTGGTVVDRGDGTVDVLVGGNALVTGDSAQKLVAIGAKSMTEAGATPHVEWAAHPGSAVAVDGGELAGAISLLAPAVTSGAGAGTGGALAETAESYNRFATDLATKVNLIYNKGTNSTLPGGDFFRVAAGVPAALGLGVIPTNASELSTGLAAIGALDGSVADELAQLGAGKAVASAGPPPVLVKSPSTDWSNFVTSLAVTTRTELQHASLADITSTAAVGAQLSNASVDLDEENVNLLMFQHAYQGAARVMTAVDEMLDTLINRTGLVGR
ncbi:flagellar hook-associated protein 1 FlgK [Cryobacterium sp. MP_M5]|uniref:flagellar hook-associated protein FlgK n=1 Tax=unclassified Cryobacterium TaxID=2649013 RepID=UPI0018CAE2C7|nr:MULTISPECIES: flagellar hook-associated protein FlgK [unclassified Cryobacterium]MBG6058447.1 flagellar hook-associated protein 1 FlgK [Cryobacterium sp. MP_M3]MEC5176901.1 flagellar hook-associated protein 1 FlgK [Cryobacterium sp. MP_M5]